jgi:hypothetical protein
MRDMRGSGQGPGNGRHRRAAAERVARAALPLATLAVVALWGCRTVPGTRAGPASFAGREVVITDSEIVRMSVRTAWDAVRLRAPRFTFAQGSGGEPTRVMIQSQRSINADETPLLVVDGMTMTDIGFLRQIPASQVRTIRILSSEAAEPVYGLGAAGGAIVVETKRGPS